MSGARTRANPCSRGRAGVQSTARPTPLSRITYSGNVARREAHRMSVALAGRPVVCTRSLALALVLVLAPRAAADPPLPRGMQVEVNWAIDLGVRYLRATQGGW